MASKIKVDTLETANGSGTITSSNPITVTGALTATTLVGDGSALTGVSGPAFYAMPPTGDNSFSASTTVKVPFSVEIFDTDSCYDPATYRFTPNKAGYYYMAMSLDIRGSGTANASMNILLNGTYVAGDKAATGLRPAGTPVWMNISSLIYFNGTTDYAEGYVYSPMTSPVIEETNDGDCFFTGCFLRGA